MTTRRANRTRRSASSPNPPQPTFSAQELIDALEAARRQAPERLGFSSVEIMRLTGWGRSRTLNCLHELARAGTLHAHREIRPSELDGIPRPITTYSIKR